MILDARERLGSKDEAQKGPKLRDYSPVVERLDRVIDSLGAVMATIVASQGGKPPKVHPQERPKTEFEHAEYRRRMKQHTSLVSRALRSQRPGR